jgi:putative peptidoglycan lipid II flippase
MNQSSAEGAQQTLSSSARAITVATCAGAAVLFAAAPPIGAFFSALDAGRHSPAGQEALAALPAALSAFAPGLVGFGLLALFTRALYARGRPGVAGGVAALGWLIAAVVPLALLRGDAGPRNTLQSLGLASSLGMTVAAVVLLFAVHRAWGPQMGQGLVRGAVVAVGSGALSAAGGRAIAGNLHPLGLATAATAAVMVTIAVLTFFAASIWIGDRESARLAAAPLRRRAR